MLQGISKKLHDRPKGKWAEELTTVVWLHNTSESRATKFTPFKLRFREEAVLPEELSHQSPRLIFPNLEEEAVTKDLAETIRCEAVNNICSYQVETIHRRDKKVNPHQISTGDMVLIRKQNTILAGKLQTKWLGPFTVTTSNRPGSFHLQNSEGNPIKHT